MTALLEVESLSLTVPGRSGPVQILSDVNLHVGAGEAVALVGESGSGKSMTARSIARLLPDAATVTGAIAYGGDSVLELRGRSLRQFRRRVSMIFQDPAASINPVRTIGDFLVEGIRAFDPVSKQQARQRAIATLSDVGISQPERRLRAYPHELSGGMLQRVMIASALLSGAGLILADEPTTALDVTTQSEVLAILGELQRERDLGLLFISHDLELAAAVCSRVYVMYAGQVVETQPTSSIEDEPLHPYTAALYGARPPLRLRRDRLDALPGRALSADQAPSGCRFRDRCRFAIEACEQSQPMESHGPGSVRCCRAGVVTRSEDVHAAQ